MVQTQQQEMALRQAIGQGFDLLRQGRAADAVRLADSLVASHRGHAHVLYFAAEARAAYGRTDDALRFLEAAIKADPGQFQLMFRKAQILLAMRRRTDARAAATEAAAHAGQDAQALQAVGQLFSQSDDPAGARPFIKRALKAAPGNPALMFDMATAQFFLGDPVGAEKNLDEVLKKQPGSGQALYLRSILKRQTKAENHVGDLERRLKVLPDGEEKASAYYALAKEYEDLGDVEKSFPALKAGADMKRASMRYDVAPECAAMEAIAKAYTKKAMQAKTAGCADEGAIFIVGMPRTGTTLVERMLGRHSQVTSAGELPDFARVLSLRVEAELAADPSRGANMVEASLKTDFAALGQDYIAGARDAVHGAPVFVDKMPVNFLYCGLIKKALPNARIIHLVRDPMDSCYAVYKTLFHRSYSFSYDLDELATYYAAYQRMMAHWHTVMPGAILDVHYEDVVRDTEAEAHRILDWCGLQWEDAVLKPSENDKASTTASAAQVRQAVYTSSVGKWRRYADGLEPLKARLMAAGVVDEDGNPVKKD
ncbi:tetratricopeptide repeat-containing sulfotransferase family protein [Kordiimonas marina]|uniref:tetratricopeptide repeat-containing sulfotransferase family protein n=1 Tax=Kordiimonas marina TaxID=2872312 RepID=UPI001FF1221C|nr:sulfotransferase [Kordiimonas marina]MCJ9427657.1 sulfotransferase [Kordiimonas marina]